MTFKRFLHKIKMGPKWGYNRIAYFSKWLLMSIAKNWILNTFNLDLRPWIWKKTGVDVKGKFRVGYDVYYDVGYAHLITIEEGVWIASRSLLLCHKRVIDDYCIGDDYNKLSYKTGRIHLKKGCCVGMGAIVMPGVTIGEGSIVGVGSLVTKDIPDWCIAVGRPAKVVRILEHRKNDDI